jgi:hypothetical protein
MNKNLHHELARQRHEYPKSQSHFLRHFPRESAVSMIRPTLKLVKHAVQIKSALEANPVSLVSGIIDRLI